MSFENLNKNSKEQAYKSVLIRLSNLISDKDIANDKYTAVRQALGSVYTTLSNEFNPNADNVEIVKNVLNKLMMLIDSNPELKESEFETFRAGLSTIIKMVNNELL